MRKQGSCLEKEIMQGTMPGACRRGRPRMAWMDNIKTCTELSIKESFRRQRTGINGKSTSMVWPTLGSRTAKDQIRPSCHNPPNLSWLPYPVAWLICNMTLDVPNKAAISHLSNSSWRADWHWLKCKQGTTKNVYLQYIPKHYSLATSWDLCGWHQLRKQAALLLHTKKRQRSDDQKI